jgi:hypothetical protein
MMNEKYIFGLVVVATTIFASISIVSSLPVADSGVSLTYNTEVCIYKNDELIQCSHNLVTDDGKDYLKECLGAGGCSGPAFVTLAIANCTNGVSAGQSSLCNGQAYTNCDLAAAAGTYADTGTAGAWNVSYEWTANPSCADLPVNATGMYNATGGTLLAENTFTSVVLQGSDRINVTWGIWVT